MSKPGSEQIFNHAQKFATPVRTTVGAPWAIVPDGDAYRGHPVTSLGFQQWLAQSFHAEYFIYPDTNALESAVRMFTTNSNFDGCSIGISPGLTPCMMIFFTWLAARW